MEGKLEDGAGHQDVIICSIKKGYLPIYSQISNGYPMPVTDKDIVVWSQVYGRLKMNQTGILLSRSFHLVGEKHTHWCKLFIIPLPAGGWKKPH